MKNLETIEIFQDLQDIFAKVHSATSSLRSIYDYLEALGQGPNKAMALDLDQMQSMKD